MGEQPRERKRFGLPLVHKTRLLSNPRINLGHMYQTWVILFVTGSAHLWLVSESRVGGRANLKFCSELTIQCVFWVNLAEGCCYMPCIV
jgi:hypothetical protein